MIGQGSGGNDFEYGQHKRSMCGTKGFARAQIGSGKSPARQIVDADPELKQHPQLRRVLQERYGERAKMYHVG
jgi:hypothetical protein